MYSHKHQYVYSLSNIPKLKFLQFAFVKFYEILCSNSTVVIQQRRTN